MNNQKLNSGTGAQSGFTLVELAIVLVIIGLIIGGVLVGQDLIKAAEIRATISDLEKFNAAATTFKGKYNALPGDIPNASAASFGFQTRTGVAGHGDGNGLIEGASAGGTLLAGESATFWTDLSTAQLVSGSYATAAADTVGSCLTLDDCLPKAKLRPTTYYTLYSTGGRNFFYLANQTLVAATSVMTPASGLQVNEAYNIDTKMDDGAPDTGSVVANSNFATLDAGAAGATGVCRNTTPAPDTYNTTAAFASEINCQLKIRASF